MRHQAFRYELDPTNRQRGDLASHAGAARFAWNWGLSRVKTALVARAWERELGAVPWTRVPNGFRLQEEWNTWKRTRATWWSEVSKCAPQSAFQDLDRAMKRFLATWGSEKSQRVGFPRWKRKGRCRDSFRLYGQIRLTGSRQIQLPRLGRLRTKEPVDKLAAKIGAREARILSATVVREAARWFVSITVEYDRKVAPQRGAPVVGIDLGLRHYATLSTGEVVANPSHLERRLRRLRRLSRSHSRKQLGSANRAKAARALAREHYRIRCARRDFLHKLSTRLTKSHGVLVVEHLNIAGMLRNRRRARRVVDAGWATFVRQLGYKAEWYGCRLVKADRWYASSKLCSSCGWHDDELTSSATVFRCRQCGLRLDRDLNAARNLAAIAASSAEMSNACGGDVSLSLAEQTPAKQEPDSSAVNHSAS